MTVGERIRTVRKERGMTQKQVAEKCGMADSAIRKYESGSQVPKTETLRKIANALNVPLLSLMETVKSTDSDFQIVKEYVGLSDSALYTLTNGIRTIPDPGGIHGDKRTLTDVLNAVLSDSTNFLTMLAFIRLATGKESCAAVWGDEVPSISPTEADRRGYEELACDYLRRIIANIPVQRFGEVTESDTNKTPG